MTTQYSECGNYKFENGSLYRLKPDGRGFHWRVVGSYPRCRSVEHALNSYNLGCEE